MKLLGQGSFGRVWKDENPPGRSGYYTPDKCIAKKVIENPDDNAWAEVQLLQSLHHENIVRCLGSYRSNSSEVTSLTIVMEYCDNGTLEKWLSSFSTEQPLPEFQIWRLVWQLSEALSFLHSQNPPLLHKYLKPASILCKSGNGGGTDIKIVYFGFCGVLGG